MRLDYDFDAPPNLQEWQKIRVDCERQGFNWRKEIMWALQWLDDDPTLKKMPPAPNAADKKAIEDAKQYIIKTRANAQ